MIGKALSVASGSLHNSDFFPNGDSRPCSSYTLLDAQNKVRRPFAKLDMSANADLRWL